MKTSMAQCLDQQQRRSNFSSQRACQFQNILCVLALGKYRPINAVAEGNINIIFLRKNTIVMSRMLPGPIYNSIPTKKSYWKFISGYF